MIRLKKKAAAAPKEDEKMADAPKANGEEKVSILGIGGRKVAKATGSKAQDARRDPDPEGRRKDEGRRGPDQVSERQRPDEIQRHRDTDTGF